MFMESYWFICGWNKHAQDKCSQEWTVHYPHDCERTLRLLEKKLVRAQTHRLKCILPKMPQLFQQFILYLKDSPVQQGGKRSHCNAAKPIQQCCFTHVNNVEISCHCNHIFKHYQIDISRYLQKNIIILYFNMQFSFV